MVRWKMSCQLMEELPVAAGRSVATGAMCVNLLPCHFFCCLPTPLPLHLHLSSSPHHHHPPSPTPGLHSLYPQQSVTNYSWRLICWLSKVFLALPWRRGERERMRMPLPAPRFTCCRCAPPAPPPTPIPLPHTHTHVPPRNRCWDVAVEIDILSSEISSD